jgi:hypothetical protein
VVVLVAALLLVADRVSRALAESAISRSLAVNAPFDRPPSVSIDGFPFLTQVVAGKYREIDISGTGLRLGDISGAGLDAHLHGIHLPLGDIVRRDVTSLPIDEIDGDVTLPYSELARLTGVAGLVLTEDGSAVRATVPVLGSASASGTGTVQVVGSAIKINVLSLEAAGVSLPSALVRSVSEAISVPIPLPALPYQLKIESVLPTATGIAVRGSASHVVLTG